MLIEPNSHWIHKREGYLVTVVDDVPYQLHIKDADSANWQDGVAYTLDQQSNDDDPLYVRGKADFLAKFTQHEGE